MSNGNRCFRNNCKIIKEPKCSTKIGMRIEILRIDFLLLGRKISFLLISFLVEELADSHLFQKRVMNV